ncbi:MAG: hypothetical protein NTZ05_03380, partial [Chloroflexi bacterium]|nr:hypothetical protein [Chloroflexota bacterium]
MTSVEFPGGGPLPTSDVRPVGTTFCLTSGVAQGQIASRHWRLSDVLNTMQQQFLLLRDGLMEQGSLPREETAVSATEIVIHLDSIILAVEARTAGMERPASSAALRTPRTVTSVVIDAGPYRIRGQAHVVPGVALLQHILDPNRPFIPITEAVVLFRRSAAGGASDLPGGYDGVVRAPFLLVNRRHLIAVALAGAAPAARSRAEEPAAPPVQEYRRLTPAAAEWSPPPAAAAPWSPPPAAPAPAPAP